MALDQWIIEKLAKLFYWRYKHTLHHEARKWAAMAEVARRQVLLNRLARCGQALELREGVEILAPERVSIGDYVAIGRHSILRGQGGIDLGDFCLLGDFVILATAGHPVGGVYLNKTAAAPIHLAENVWVGAGAIILPGVRIGENAVVAAGAVVREDVPANSLVGGVPARVLKAFPVDEAANAARKDQLRRQRGHWPTDPPQQF
jgi:acetyltransferase-like isoleucine patch superfamily enzyme